jgi:endo-1,3(4)-beta-glucanase
MTMAKAVIDPSTAWTEARPLGSYDDGNSKTNTLYWIATRPK